ncbi:putative sodium/hydrogen antiporter (plasmid) [Selenomonas ruminantium subsp. lactilytica TAM6421]|uniref:Putative sodium/hydrogen antiporter n=1 Tax=Selenomonas ruminantium subsp. lactilytica (strain NBRC 103574 / TAM6421) TaxID=927704 RepID=I0GWD0_SELRL|nr:Na+/H+ antiporter NhaC family protein [Selenomonas ruminantium]BAL85067.1 putative sodium/hydrogen antiporter [Selenomonas ruminantium subsp. lactilytica TAM6421]
MKQTDCQPRPHALALLPILVFLLLYLGAGIWYEYIAPVEGQMGFYVMSVVVAFGLALIVAFVQNRKRLFVENIQLCAQSIGDVNITIMLFIFLMAGAFSGIAKAAGGVESTAHLLLNFVPGTLAVPGLFLIACLISMSMGTSVGTITVLVPIAASVAENAGLSLPLTVASVVGGAMFGDNLSFISDTTIAATRTQGTRMQDKFYANLKLALPAALITLILLVILSLSGGAAELGTFDYSLLLALPYFLVLLMALTGRNVFLVLGTGILLFFVLGLATGMTDLSRAFSAMGAGTNGMFETMIVTILAASISAIMRDGGGFAALLAFIRQHFKGRRGGRLGIGLLTILMDVATANNTVAIVVAGPIARNISEEYGIEPRESASLLDTCSCIAQGIIPYGAQLLIASAIAGITSLSIIPFLFYPFFLAMAVLIWIALDRKNV